MHLCTAGILKGPVVQILYQFKKSSKKGGSVTFNWNIWTSATLPLGLGFSILSMTKCVGFSWGCSWSVRVSLFITLFVLTGWFQNQICLSCLSGELDSILPGHLLVFKIANHHLHSWPVTSFCFLILHKLKKYKRSFTDPKFFYDISIDLGH